MEDGVAGILAAFPEWKRRQLLEHVTLVDANFRSEGGLGNAGEAH